jgi:hypothetical protein
MLFPGRDAKFTQNRHFFAHGARAHFDEGERCAVVAGLVDFPFTSAGSEVSGYENVAAATEVPGRVGFAADAGPAGLELFYCGRGIDAVTRSFSRGPKGGLEKQSRSDRHGLSTQRSGVSAKYRQKSHAGHVTFAATTGIC